MNMKTTFYPSLNRFFNTIPANLFEAGSGEDHFRVDIEEHDNEYRIHADLPGVRKEDLAVNVEDNVLTISAKFSRKTDEKNAKALRRERVSGSSARQFMLPHDVEQKNIQASLESGVLHLTLSKGEDKRKHHIAIA